MASVILSRAITLARWRISSRRSHPMTPSGTVLSPSGMASDSGVSCLVYLAYTLWPLGEIAHARRLADEALAHAQSTGHLATVAYALGHVCELDLLWRDTGRLLQHANRLSP